MDTSNFKEVFESPKVKELTAQVAALEAEVMRLREALRSVAEKSLAELTAIKVDNETAWAQAHRLALELECLLLDTKDNAIVSKWWDSGMAALNEYQQLKPGTKEDAEAWAKMRKAGL